MGLEIWLKEWVVALYLFVPFLPKTIWPNLLMLIVLACAISISESSSVKAEIGHVVSWDGQFELNGGGADGLLAINNVWQECTD